jgi:addiction module HigA family antidote
MAVIIHPSFTVHAGTWLKAEIIKPHGLSVTVGAKMLGVTRQAMSNLLNGKAGLSAEMAIGFEKAFGISAATMLHMQTTHGLARARAV